MALRLVNHAPFHHLLAVLLAIVLALGLLLVAGHAPLAGVPG